MPFQTIGVSSSSILPIRLSPGTLIAHTRKLLPLSGLVAFASSTVGVHHARNPPCSTRYVRLPSA